MRAPNCRADPIIVSPLHEKSTSFLSKASLFRIPPIHPLSFLHPAQPSNLKPMNIQADLFSLTRNMRRKKHVFGRREEGSGVSVWGEGEGEEREEGF